MAEEVSSWRIESKYWNYKLFRLPYRSVADLGELNQADVTFLVLATLNAMSPPAGRTGQTGTQLNRTGGDLRAGSLTFTGSRDAKRPARISGSLYQATFLCKFSFKYLFRNFSNISDVA